MMAMLVIQPRVISSSLDCLRYVSRSPDPQIISTAIAMAQEQHFAWVVDPVMLS
jgi:hypothetical protein